MKTKKKPPAAVAYIWVTSMGIRSRSSITEERWKIEADQRSDKKKDWEGNKEMYWDVKTLLIRGTGIE